MNRKIGLFTSWPRTWIHWSIPPICTDSRLLMPVGEVMARSSATLCCRYFRYNRADESSTTAKQTIAITAYLRIFQIMSLTEAGNLRISDTHRLALLFRLRTSQTGYAVPSPAQRVRLGGSSYG